MPNSNLRQDLDNLSARNRPLGYGMSDSELADFATDAAELLGRATYSDDPALITEADKLVFDARRYQYRRDEVASWQRS